MISTIQNAAFNGERNESMGNPEKIKVLMYHRVVDDEVLCYNYPKLCIHVDDFHTHLMLLDRWGYTPITFNDFRLFQDGELNLPKRPIIITFDDGYEEIYKLAFPLLQEFGMKAVIFALGDRTIRSNIWDTATDRIHVPLLNDVQMIELHSSGFEIGSHSLTHQKLTLIPKEKAWDEISRSRMLLEILLNAPVRTFAYPYGLMNTGVKEMVIDAGYSNACAVYSGPPTFGADPFEIRRITIFSTTKTVGLRIRLLPIYRYYRWLRWKTKSLLFTNKTEDQTIISIDEMEKLKTLDFSKSQKEKE